jgi:hypothetical protein
MSQGSRPVKVYDPRAERVLFDALRGRVRGRTELVKLTRGDAVALTGLPTEQAEPALKSLVRTYRSHLAVTEDGELVYEFDPSLERRDRVPLREKLERAGRAVWRGFTVFFKVWIAVTMVAYVVAFVAMMIALMTARSSSDRDDRRGGGGFGLPWIWYWMLPDLAPRPSDRYGRPVRREGPPPKRFYHSVFDFVFGPKAAPVDARALEKRVLAFLRDHRGRITSAELTALTGLALDDADEELTRLMVDYDGEVEVAEDGTLIYVFNDVLTSAGETGGFWRWAWDEPEPQATLTGNTSGANAVVVGFTAFNLLASFTVGPAFLHRFHLAGDPILTFFITLFPLMFSALFFAIPAGRLLVERGRTRKKDARRIRRELLREIWAAPPAAPPTAIDPPALAQLVADRTSQPVDRVRASLEKLLAELDGDVDTDAEGRMRYLFPRLAEEQAAVAKARLAAGAAPKLGPVAFSSEDAPG